MAQTRQDIICEYLALKGNQEVRGKSSRYRVFRSRKQPKAYYYVGKAGAVRIGTSIADSVSCTHKIQVDDLKKVVEKMKGNC